MLYNLIIVPFVVLCMLALAMRLDDDAPTKKNVVPAMSKRELILRLSAFPISWAVIGFIWWVSTL